MFHLFQDTILIVNSCTLQEKPIMTEGKDWFALNLSTCIDPFFPPFFEIVTFQK